MISPDYGEVMMKMYAVACLCAVALITTVSANNLVITNVSLENVTNGAADIQFDMSWDNSWRTSWTDNGGSVGVTNWDAVWVFAKYRQSGGLWKHAQLTVSNHTATGGTIIETSNDGGSHLGAFVYPAAESSGTRTCNDMAIKWNYSVGGLGGTNEVDIVIMGIEMVYIPEGSFSLGSGGTEVSRFYRYPDTSDSFVITNEGEIAVGTVTGQLYYTSGGDFGGPIPAAFPKGYGAIYCMKYEITEGQYADFLNLLDPGIANGYYPNKYDNSRHKIRETNGVYQSDAPDRACNYLSGVWILTYFDWCGLRPMSEFEFEKICRGVKSPWIDEFAWGNSSYVELTGESGVEGSGSETALPTNANVHVTTTISGPVRTGIFADAASSRVEAGAGYYGNMDLSGNLREMAVAIGRPEGRAFIDEYGDGDEYSAYPWYTPVSGRAYTSRGGAWSDTPSNIQRFRTSDRTYSDASVLYAGSSSERGARGVRTAP
ncbi:MAG: hypothetical protein KJ626_01920 [Verrucomicrobia bacterium]|nr:hypothetical protein [Verrucomicrobiota bacterium]